MEDLCRVRKGTTKVRFGWQPKADEGEHRLDVYGCPVEGGHEEDSMSSWLGRGQVIAGHLTASPALSLGGVSPSPFSHINHCLKDSTWNELSANETLWPEHVAEPSQVRPLRELLQFWQVDTQVDWIHKYPCTLFLLKLLTASLEWSFSSFRLSWSSMCRGHCAKQRNGFSCPGSDPPPQDGSLFGIHQFGQKERGTG